MCVLSLKPVTYEAPYVLLPNKNFQDADFWNWSAGRGSLFNFMALDLYHAKMVLYWHILFYCIIE